MDASSALRHGTRIASISVLLSAAAAFALGCEQSDAKAEPKAAASAPEAASTEPAAPEATADSSSPTAGQPSYEEDAFHLSLEGPDSAKSGEKASLKVILTAQSGYKINDEYPIKFQFAEMAKVVPDKAVVRKEDAKVEKLRVEIPLSVTVQAPGKHQVSGRLSFSVCTDERCLIEKRDLMVKLDAS